MPLDPITFEVIRNALLMAAMEMKGVVVRTAYSTLWKEAGDLSCGLLTRNCEVVAQGMGDIPAHLATMPFSVRGCVERIGEANLRPGDVLYQNDPYCGNNHLPDFIMAKPIFLDGVILGYSAVRGHYVDVGGVGPGSYSTAVRDIYAEGLRIAPLKLWKQGELNEDIVSVLQTNTRNARERLGDLRAQYAGCVIGERRILALAARYGPELLVEAMEEVLRYSERLTRTEIGKIKPGVYHFVDYCDGDGLRDEPLRLEVTVTVEADRIKADFTGTSPQARGGMNAPYAVTASATQYAVKCLTDPWNPANSGSYRAVEVVAPEGSLLNPRPPAPVVAGNHETASRVADAVIGALAQAAPERAIAAGSGSSAVIAVGGIHPATGREYVWVETHGSGQGASRDQDGVHATRVNVGNTGNTPVESIELNYPVLTLEYSVADDSGGPGRRRGGLTIRRRFRLLDDATAIVTCERGRVPPYGLFGGQPGRPARIVLNPGTPEERVLPTKTPPIDLPAGTLVDYRPAGGGGYGDPLEREPERVLDDVLDGYVSVESAREDYGVVLHPTPDHDLTGGYVIDEAATRALRARRRT